MPRASRPLLLLLACAGCAHRPATPPAKVGGSPAGQASGAPASLAPPQPARADRLAAIRAQVDDLLGRQAKLLWEAWTRGAAPDFALSLAGREVLVSRDTVAFVREERDRAGGDDRRALGLLHGYLVGEHLARELEGSARADAPVAVAWSGRAVPSWRVPALLAAEPEAGRRAALERAWVEAERRRAEPERRRWRALEAAAGRLGYGSLLALAGDLRGQPADALAGLADGVLASTDAAYRGALEALARSEMGKGLAQLRGRDLPRLLRAGEDARPFAAARWTAYALDALAALGLDLGSRPGSVVDAEPRSGKDPRPLTLPVEVPNGVRVSYVPGGGPGELRALLHELGAAAFYARVTTPVVEFRRLGAVTAVTWGALFEDLACDPAWLSARTGASDAQLAPIVLAGVARRLHQARTLAARILVEARGAAAKPSAAKAILEIAFARPVDPEELELFLLDRDPLLESADRLQAVLLSAQAQRALARLAPPAWWRSKESGAWLTRAFADGSRLAPAELAGSFGARSVDASALDAIARDRVAKAGVRPLAAAP